jgi:hypothetical protein
MLFYVIMFIYYYYHYYYNIYINAHIYINTDAQVCLELAILPDTTVPQLHPEMGLLFIRRRALAPRQSGERRRQVTKRKQVAWHGNVLSGEA